MLLSFVALAAVVALAAIVVAVLDVRAAAERTRIERARYEAGRPTFPLPAVVRVVPVREREPNRGPALSPSDPRQRMGTSEKR